MILLLLAVLAAPAPAQESNINFDVSGSLDWIRGELNAQASFNLAGAGIKLPAGRIMAEEILQRAYPRLLLPFLLSLRVDSGSSVKDLLDRGELSREALDILCQEAERVPPSLSPDLVRMTGRYTVPLEKASALLNRHRRAIEAARPLVPVETAAYTGIIIIAEEELPVHGRNSRAFLEPCLSPKVWDTNMNLVYERNMVDPVSAGRMVRYTVSENIFRPTPSGLEGELAGLVGPRPLHVLAREAFGVNPTDPVIDRDDALKILSTENNRRLLREGRVVLVVNEKTVAARTGF